MDIMKLFDLSGKTALVTGSSRGIGKGIADILASAGAKVFIHGTRLNDQLEETVNEIKAAGGEAEGVAADLGSEEEVAALIKTVGSCDILVLNASVQAYQELEDFTSEEFERQYNVNVRSTFELIKGFLPGMQKKHWGRILTIGSVNQFTPSPRLPVYSSTKSAMVNIVMGCAKKYAPDGVTVNNLAPGVICTDRNKDALADEEYRKHIVSLVPSGILGGVEDCAGLSLVLCSEAGRYITGSDIPVTGGMHLK